MRFLPSPPPREHRELAQPAIVQVVAADGHAIPREQLALVEELDDVIFAALDGDADALDRVASLWLRTDCRAACDRLEAEVLEESRRQYVRRAKSICRDYRRDPARCLAPAFAAQEVLTLVEPPGDAALGAD